MLSEENVVGTGGREGCGGHPSNVFWLRPCTQCWPAFHVGKIKTGALSDSVNLKNTRGSIDLTLSGTVHEDKTQLSSIYRYLRLPFVQGHMPFKA